MEFTSAETVGVERVVVKALGFLVGLAVDEGYTEPTIPSTGVSVGGLVGSVLGRGA